MRVIVAIPTTNRPTIALPTVRDIARQSRIPDLVVVVVASARDIDAEALSNLPFPVFLVQGERGLTVQRNMAMAMLQANDCLLFLDDDFLMAADYLANLERLFEQNPDVVMATGTVLADGIKGPGLGHDFAMELVSDAKDNPAVSRLTDTYNCYGCNMALRARPAVEHGLRFDQRLKLYGWLEDVDFSRQMAVHGRIVQSEALRGVHLGTKTGRSSGLRLGYSQVANPLYLNAKGTMALRRALNIMWRNLASNLVKSLYPEPEIDRVGRLKGNFKAIGDLLRGSLRPEQVMTFE